MVFSAYTDSFEPRSVPHSPPSFASQSSETLIAPQSSTTALRAKFEREALSLELEALNDDSHILKDTENF